MGRGAPRSAERLGAQGTQGLKDPGSSSSWPQKQHNEMVAVGGLKLKKRNHKMLVEVGPRDFSSGQPVAS